MLTTYYGNFAGRRKYEKEVVERLIQEHVEQLRTDVSKKHQLTEAEGAVTEYVLDHVERAAWGGGASPTVPSSSAPPRAHLYTGGSPVQTWAAIQRGSGKVCALFRLARCRGGGQWPL